MVKLFSTEHKFDHPFDRVTSAFWRKYPNQYATHLKAIDIIDRRIDTEGRLITNRIQSCYSNVPSWARTAGLQNTCFVAETSVVDPKNKEMVVKSSNLTGSSVLVIEETCSYKASTTSPKQTDYRQDVRITSFLPLIASRFEQHTFQSISNKSKEGIAFVEQLCQRISQDGVLSLLENAFSSSSSGTPPSSSA